jgi:hypothetical protein
VTGRRNIIIAVSALVLFAAVVGFYITLDVSPQIAYARLFIDLGLAIGLAAVILALYKEPQLMSDTIIQVIKSLSNNNYKARINTHECGPLSSIGGALNELAKNLEEQHAKQEEIKRNLREELLPNKKQSKEMPSYEHSFHPELGPVYSVATPLENKVLEQKLSNALVESTPPKVPKLEEEEQDLGELYQRFIDAQREIDQHQIEYTLFLKTIEQSRMELMKTHACRTILFDIVKETKQVALQPRIVR